MDKPHVIVVDDDAFSRNVVASQLERFDAVVIQAGDGVEALRLMQQQIFDLAIVDLEMPQVNGYDLLGCIRGSPRLRHMPVIVLTAHEDRTSLERALISGATSFLIKPLNWRAFGAHIRHLLLLSRNMHGAERAQVATVS